MKKVLLLMGLLCSAISVSAQNNVAVTTKSQGEVNLRRATAEEYIPNLAIGTSIQNSDWIKTGDDGFGVLVFIDDKSQLKIREQTEIEIQGDAEKQAAALQKEIQIGNGQLKAEINPGRRGSFTITSPTSVAAVKGTQFWFSADSTDGDLVVVLEGVVDLTNRISGELVTIETNQTGRSAPDGSIEVLDNFQVGGEVIEFTPSQEMTLTDIRVVQGEPQESIDNSTPFIVNLNPYTAYETEVPSIGNEVFVTGFINETGGFIGHAVEIVENYHNLDLRFENNSGERKTLKIEYR